MTRRTIPILLVIGMTAAAGCTQTIEEPGRQPSLDVKATLQCEAFQTGSGPVAPVWKEAEQVQMYDGFERRRFIKSDKSGMPSSGFNIPLNRQASSYFVVRARDLSVVKLTPRNFELIAATNCGFSKLQSGKFEEAAIGAGLCEDIKDTVFEVRNILGGVQFSLESEDAVYAEFSSFDGKQQVAGNISVDISTGEPIGAFTGESSSNTITAGPIAPGECYISTLPSEFSKGVKVRLLDNEKRAVYTTWFEDTVRVERSAFTDLGSVDSYRFHYFPVGEGTEQNPYVIGSPLDFNNLVIVTNSEQLHEQYNDKHYVLTADIDCSRYGNTGPVAAAYPFTGVLDGASHKIANFVSSRTDSSPCGLFGSLEGAAVVKNLTLENATISGTGASVGGIAGLVKGGTVSGCTVDTASTITSQAAEAGGIVGTIKADTVVTVSKCSFGGTLSALYHVGGIAGSATSYNKVEISSCSVKGAHITATLYKDDSNHYVGLGGILGYGYPYTGGPIIINGCLCRTSVVESTSEQTADGCIGGILGYTYGTKACCTVSNCYACPDISSVTQTDNKGAIFGYLRWGSTTNYTKVHHCYYPEGASIGNNGKGVLENNSTFTMDESTDGTLLGLLQNSSDGTVWLQDADGWPAIQGMNQ